MAKLTAPTSNRPTLGPPPRWLAGVLRAPGGPLSVAGIGSAGRRLWRLSIWTIISISHINAPEPAPRSGGQLDPRTAWLEPAPILRVGRAAPSAQACGLARGGGQCAWVPRAQAASSLCLPPRAGLNPGLLLRSASPSCPFPARSGDATASARSDQIQTRKRPSRLL